MIINTITNKKYSDLYSGLYLDKYFEIEIYNDCTIGIEYDLIKGQYNNDEVERLANNILNYLKR